MGSQVNFYMVPEDEEEFCRFVVSDPTVTILRASHLHEPHVPVLLPLPPSNEPDCGGLVFWNRKVASREEVMPRGRVRDTRSPAGRYVIDATLNPVVDFDRSVRQPDGLAPGRIWAGFDEWHHLPEERLRLYRSWFQRLARWLNKWPYRWDVYRIGPRTKAFFDGGGKAIGYGLGEIKSVTQTGECERVIRRDSKVHTIHPEIEQDNGATDVTIHLDEEPDDTIQN